MELQRFSENNGVKEVIRKQWSFRGFQKTIQRYTENNEVTKEIRNNGVKGVCRK